MSREDYEKVRGLVSRIDDVSNSANIMRKIIDGFNKNGGTARLYANTEGERYETELSVDTAKVAFQEILKSYNNFILKCKNEIDEIINRITEME